MQLIFLGTGGGRFVMSFQKRKTGGFLIKSSVQIHVDPGPGALVNAWQTKENPTKTRLIFVSHSHPDHCVDTPAIVEAMTEGTRKHRGMLIGSKAFLEGNNDVQGISEYHKSLTDWKIGIPGDELSVSDMNIRITKAFHTEETAIGFVLDDGKIKLGYTSDSGVQNDFVKQFKGVDAIIMNTIAPDKEVFEDAMSLGGAIELVNAAKPKLAIIQHFGIRALRYGPERMARDITEETGVKCIAAKDFMRLDLAKELGLEGLSRFM